MAIKALPNIGGLLYEMGLKIIPLIIMGLLAVASFWF